jgi:hypothetical protein
VPSSGAQQLRRRAVYREPARRISIAGGVLVLPAVVYYGVPVILNVPELGYVDVPEDEYARFYDKLSSSDSELVQEAMSSLRRNWRKRRLRRRSAGRKGWNPPRGFERADFFRRTVEDGNSSEGTLLIDTRLNSPFARAGPRSHRKQAFRCAHPGSSAQLTKNICQYGRLGVVDRLSLCLRRILSL